ncbi:TPA: IS21 family transposase, partial [Legionella pneumophila]|nr:IS21 family transposase [Legionella pneumophila]
RVHATTGAIPFERLLDEQATLQPLSSTYSGKLFSHSENKEIHYFSFQLLDNTAMQHDLSIYQKLLERTEEAA